MKRSLLLSSIVLALTISSNPVKADPAVDHEESFGSRIAHVWERIKALGKNVMGHLVPDSEEEDNPDANVNLGHPKRVERPESTKGLLSEAQGPSQQIEPGDVASNVQQVLLGDLIPSTGNESDATASPTTAPLAVVSELRSEAEQEGFDQERDLYKEIGQEGDVAHVAAVPYIEPTKGGTVQVIDMGGDPTPDDGTLLAEMASAHSGNKNVMRLGLDQSVAAG